MDPGKGRTLISEGIDLELDPAFSVGYSQGGHSNSDTPWFQGHQRQFYTLNPTMEFFRSDEK